MNSIDRGGTRKVLWFLAVILLALFALYIWPTRYAYYAFPRRDAVPLLLRVERFTGQVEIVFPTKEMLAKLR